MTNQLLSRKLIRVELIVIIDREHYKEIVKKYAFRQKYCEKLDTDPQKTERIKYNKFIKNYKDNLTQK